ncbi:hypothetical protein SAMN05444280_12549 [Tangfeifania diversioriginum]|uniref:DUF5683 domain-containing protein n=1 Tax=Tangfeifania diversioriginum TaxID=1168035 RepID=A0A1M6L2U4_9BACT|nr:hypothetical protein SAMN05444280_12549 [Tangfeifania diversioriginum]
MIWNELLKLLKTKIKVTKEGLLCSETSIFGPNLLIVDIRGFLLKISLILLQLLVVFNLHAQLVNADTIKQVEKKPVKEEEVHSPKKAAIYSAVLPGLGQAYNKKYWKIPLVYIGFGTIGYFIKWNNDNYQFNKMAYNHLIDDNPETNRFQEIDAIKYYDLDNPTHFNNFRDGLIKRQDYYRRNRDLLVISMVAFYGINIIDASVDAHLFNFDISDDLTFNWEPSMLNINDNLVYCFNFKFNF